MGSMGGSMGGMGSMGGSMMDYDSSMYMGGAGCKDATQNECAALDDCEWAANKNGVEKCMNANSDNFSSSMSDDDFECSDLNKMNKCNQKKKCMWDEASTTCMDNSSDDSGSKTCADFDGKNKCNKNDMCQWDNKNGVCGDAVMTTAAPVVCADLNKKKCKSTDGCMYKANSDMCMDDVTTEPPMPVCADLDGKKKQCNAVDG